MGQGHDNNLFSAYLVHERNSKCPTLYFILLFFQLLFDCERRTKNDDISSKG